MFTYVLPFVFRFVNLTNNSLSRCRLSYTKEELNSSSSDSFKYCAKEPIVKFVRNYYSITASDLAFGSIKKISAHACTQHNQTTMNISAVGISYTPSLCKFWQQGKCKHGQKCRFKHAVKSSSMFLFHR